MQELKDVQADFEVLSHVEGLHLDIYLPHKTSMFTAPSGTFNRRLKNATVDSGVRLRVEKASFGSISRDLYLGKQPRTY